jgi:putative ATP-dependent endonuclease of OLD family
MYLSKMTIRKFRGLDEMTLEFNQNINIIIGENGAHKSTVIDAIRLLYNLGEPRRNIFVSDEDFYTDLKTGNPTTEFSIAYEFRDLTEKEKGALYQYIVLKEGNHYAAITITYTRRSDRHPKFDFFTGVNPGQKADTNTFEIFQHYYLGALRDSTSDLLSSRSNPLGSVIFRTIERNKTEAIYATILKEANTKLLNNKEVKATKESINSNLSEIHKETPHIDLHIEQTKANYIVNAIKPYLPFSEPLEEGTGLNLRQNSLGHNNLVYISTVLSDMNDRVETEEVIHFALLIEEPEAHLHPQLQLNLYNFLKIKNRPGNCQLFITTHSPTLTSRVELSSLFIIDSQTYKCIGNCFTGREGENIKDNETKLTEKHYGTKRKMLERYIDVTKSQMFYAKSVLMVEGISEELLFAAFAQIEGFRLEEHDIELVQTGTSFYPFMLLFNSTDIKKRLGKKVAVVTDDDRFTDSKKEDYSFTKLTADNFLLVETLYEKIKNSSVCSRIGNLEQMRNSQEAIRICTAYKTLEYELSFANVPNKKSDFDENRLIKYMREQNEDKFKKIDEYLETCCNDELDEPARRKLAILLWKAMPSKADFAQDFAIYLIENLHDAKQDFNVPNYIRDAFSHLK